MNKYTIRKTLGEGGYGKALLVQRNKDNMYFVIKEVRMSNLKPQEKADAKKEVQVLHALSHPNIVAYVESFEENGKLYIVMEYADGGDLSQKIESRGRKLFTEREILHYFIQIALALKYMHDRKILHRDLKGQNVFLNKNGNVKLGDFGIAKVLDSTAQLCRTQIGTPYYLSPEICEGKRYNSKTDIWSLGCILYELCTLRHAFDAANMNQLLVNIIRGRYVPISSQYSQDLRSLVARMLTKDPKKRPSINQIIHTPYIESRLNQFLDEEVLKYELNHTILHGRKPLAAPTILLNKAGTPQEKQSRLAPIPESQSPAKPNNPKRIDYRKEHGPLIIPPRKDQKSDIPKSDNNQQKAEAERRKAEAEKKKAEAEKRRQEEYAKIKADIDKRREQLLERRRQKKAEAEEYMRLKEEREAKKRAQDEAQRRKEREAAIEAMRREREADAARREKQLQERKALEAKKLQEKKSPATPSRAEIVDSFIQASREKAPAWAVRNSPQAKKRLEERPPFDLGLDSLPEEPQEPKPVRGPTSIARAEIDVEERKRIWRENRDAQRRNRDKVRALDYGVSPTFAEEPPISDERLPKPERAEISEEERRRIYKENREGFKRNRENYIQREMNGSPSASDQESKSEVKSEAGKSDDRNYGEEDIAQIWSRQREESLMAVGKEAPHSAPDVNIEDNDFISDDDDSEDSEEQRDDSINLALSIHDVLQAPQIEIDTEDDEFGDESGDDDEVEESGHLMERAEKLRMNLENIVGIEKLQELRKKMNEDNADLSGISDNVLYLLRQLISIEAQLDM